MSVINIFVLDNLNIDFMANKLLIFLVGVLMSSCAGSSEIISMSSRNVTKGETIIIASASLNPTISPLCQENIDTINRTAERIFANYNNPVNPVVSAHFMHGVTNYYEAGAGLDLSLFGFTAILNNKIGITDLRNPHDQKRFGISYYNKSSFTRGGTAVPATYDPFKLGHFEIGNYLILGYFFGDYELIISPHIDYNYLMSRGTEHFYINSSGQIIPECHTSFSDNAIPSTITNRNLPFFIYGVNVALKTEYNVFFELGFQYIDVKTNLFEHGRAGPWQFSIGVGYSFNVDD